MANRSSDRPRHLVRSFDGDRTNLAVLQDNITARLLCVAHLHLRQYEEATEQCSRSLNMIGANLQAYISLISAYGSTDKWKRHAKAMPLLHKTHPNLHCSFIAGCLSILK